MTDAITRPGSTGAKKIFHGTAMALFVAGSGASAIAQPLVSDYDDGDVITVEGQAGDYKPDSKSPKYTAPLLDTPRSVSVISEDVMRDMAAASLSDALRTVPGITMAMGEGGQPFADRPFIRGSESTSGLLVDGLRDSSAQSRDVFNLEQIEVAKGPNGAFAGRGAPGGSINLVTKRAKAEDFLNVSLRGGNADQKRAEIDVNQALTDDLALRINMMWQESDVPGRDAVFDNRWGFAPTVTWGLTKATKVTASFEHYEGEALTDYGHPLDLVTGQPVEGIDADNFYGLINRDFNNTKLDSGIFEVSHDLNDQVTLRNITRLSKSTTDYIATNPDDSQGNVANGLVFRNTKSTNASTETLVNQTDLTARFVTGTIGHSVATGFEFSSEETDRATYSVDLSAPGGVTIPRGGCDAFGAGPSSGYNCTDLYNPDPTDPWTGLITLNDPTTTEVDTIGAYVFDTMTLSDQWLVNIGVRFDDFSTETSTNLSNDDQFVTYQAGVVYKPRENGSIYASYGTSANPSGVTAGDGSENLSLSNEDLEPEKGRNYEIGTKWELYGDRLSLNAALFRTEIVDDHVSVEAGRGAPQEAIGETRVQGLELSVAGQITPIWSIFSGYSYLNSEIVDAGPVNTDYVGNVLPNTPEHSFSLWTTVVPTDRLTVGGGTQYVSERFGNTANTKSVDGYWRLDGVATYALSDKASFQLNVQNLTDERYYERVYATHMATVAAGRSITGTLRLSF
ncbi:TonB-dependent siderophore receptor [Parvularcula sp. LCG005]|uniref:TonB-dependent receptor n=1 Tax=Parvularcula sp. LCG005 TaxID=3078805 RepID=UPI002941F351|nr:TonB-dependent siderophore receptor [Parvularcula sp. LCG005]WOI52337.1 TonB-dependent siderophore receptor [Parvularcula sp. LCG005]